LLFFSRFPQLPRDRPCRNRHGRSRDRLKPFARGSLCIFSPLARHHRLLTFFRRSIAVGLRTGCSAFSRPRLPNSAFPVLPSRSLVIRNPTSLTVPASTFADRRELLEAVLYVSLGYVGRVVPGPSASTAPPAAGPQRAASRSGRVPCGCSCYGRSSPPRRRESIARDGKAGAML